MRARLFNARPLLGLQLIAPLLAALALVLAHSAAWPQAAGPTVDLIRIAGNQRVDDDAIRIHITQRPGEPLDEAAVDADIKSIYNMGFFDQVTVQVEHERGKTILVYRVKERPQIIEVKFQGMKQLRPESDEVTDATKVHSGAILDPAGVQATLTAIKELYEKKGYLDVNVAFKPVLRPGNTVVAVFDVNEGPEVVIRQVDFKGNRHFSARTLRGALWTGAHNILSFLTGSGVLDRKKLQEDVERLSAFYYGEGYLNVHVSEPRISRTGNSLTVTFTIDEGPVYRLRSIELTGELKFREKELRDKLKEKPGQIFRGTTMQHDVLTLSDFYSDRGYAFVRVDPRTHVDAATHAIDVAFTINPGQEVLVDRINILGNTRTADKVIRREVQIQEQEPYSGEKIAESKERLDHLGFFSETRITTAPAPQPDRIDLNVQVHEGNTATFQMAGGFSSASSIFGDFRLGNTNLFGGGQAVLLDATVGFYFRNYSISYTEPWFLDMPLSVGGELYDTQTFFYNFTRTAAGFALNTAYPLSEFGLKKLGPISLKQMSAGLAYRYESVGIGQFSQFTAFDIRRFKGYSHTSELIPSLRRFTVDNPIDPRQGSVQSLTMQLAGAGGDNKFIKGVFHTRFFLSFIDSSTWGNWVNSPGVDFGIGTNLVKGTAGELPLQERFFPGGTGGEGDVRGYELYSLGPRVILFTRTGVPFTFEEVGGSKELLLSDEITFPLLTSFGLRGVVFVDAGNSYRLRDSITLDSLAAAYGAGIRWRSPFGPLRIELARPINPRAGDVTNDFVFGAGSPL